MDCQNFWRDGALLGARREPRSGSLDESLRQLARPGQVRVNGSRCAPAIRDCPNNERLTALTIPRREHAGYGSHEGTVHFQIAAGVLLRSQLLEKPSRLRVQETHRKQDEIGIDFEFTTRDSLGSPILLLDADRVEFTHLAIIAGESVRHDR